jgi:hypothetical protein
MRVTKRQLRRIIKEEKARMLSEQSRAQYLLSNIREKAYQLEKEAPILRESEAFLSHTKEPKPGENVVNTNPKCKHYGSEGVVMDVFALDGDMGKVVKYVVTNFGDSYSPGDILEKTLDQVEGQ